MSESQDVDITQRLISQWLQSKHCTLWQQWDIVSDSGLAEASQWMLEQIASIVAFAQSNNEQVL